ncbi:hypothetical protein GmHk_03G007137 [Glycine max]|nr:hypothetical protein GmHk_03G007137 [Glycine max]
MHLTSTLKYNVIPFIRKWPKRVHATLSLKKTRQQVSRSPCRAQATLLPPPPNVDQPKSQGSSKPSDMPPSTSIPPYEKLQVLTDKVYTISMQYEV